MCLRRGGSSMRILNLSSLSGLLCSTREKYSCFISFSRRDGRPGYIDEPPERTMCLYSSPRMSTGAAWTVLKSISALKSSVSMLCIRRRSRKKGERTGNTRLLDVDEMRLEHALGRLEPLRANLDDTPVGEL